VRECGPHECVKWGQPCYANEGANVAIIGPFKEYCALMFFKGALLKDPKGLLRQPGQVQAGRHFAAARRSETRAARIEKALPRISKVRGLLD
jgi:uncharacterized protein YdeI (YjbR/CyaY-like superfamily)